MEDLNFEIENFSFEIWARENLKIGNSDFEIWD